MVYLQEYKGRTKAHVRIWYKDGEEYLPGKGLTLPNDPVIVHELADALHALADAWPWKNEQ